MSIQSLFNVVFANTTYFFKGFKLPFKERPTNPHNCPCRRCVTNDNVDHLLWPTLPDQINSLSNASLSCQVAINWCICKGTIPIPGVKSITQAEENLGALGWRLSSNELLQLEDAAQQSPRRMIQNIFQTRYTCYSAYRL